jgi:hypothetical protein
MLMYLVKESIKSWITSENKDVSPISVYSNAQSFMYRYMYIYKV